MKIRVGLLEKDFRYVSSLMGYFNTHYSQSLELFAFSNLETLEIYLSAKKLDVLLADSEILPADFEVPKFTVLSYLADTPDVDTIRNVRAVCKYQKAELIYREILSLYAEMDQQSVYKITEDACPVYLFLGASGGVGTTTMAVACAQSFAAAGKKVLYLNAEENGVVAPFLSGEGAMTLSDVLYTVKSNSANLALKMESMIRRDKSGVSFFEPFAVTLDAHEITKDDLAELLNTMVRFGAFDCIVVDTDSVITDKRNYLIKLADFIFVVGSGSSLSNAKLERLIQEFALMEERDESRILARVQVLYNGFGSNSVRADLKNIGEYATINRYSGGTPAQIVNEIIRKNIFASML